MPATTNYQRAYGEVTTRREDQMSVQGRPVLVASGFVSLEPEDSSAVILSPNFSSRAQRMR
ncbi:hypothetical protein [Streptomyces sp. NPDC001828]|uniref:hypothetical protein n=1 Tax=Streptomyces sp. NPDC001828 TaxID=3364615 RepID=UPI0036835EEB